MIQKWDYQEINLKGAYLIKPFFASDERGGLIKDYNIDVFKEHGIDHELKEVFYTLSKRGVIRATHFQLIKQQTKLVRCVSGHVYDVIVDLRPDSPTYGQWRGFHLTGENMRVYDSRKSKNRDNPVSLKVRRISIVVEYLPETIREQRQKRHRRVLANRRAHIQIEKSVERCRVEHGTDNGRLSLTRHALEAVVRDGTGRNVAQEHIYVVALAHAKAAQP